MNFRSAIELRDVTKTYGEVEAIANLSLTIDEGSTIAFLGPNGAGKSTLLNMIMGSVKVSSGRISVLGQKPGSVGVRLRSGVMLQVTGVPETLTVSEHIRLFRTYYVEPMQFESIVQIANLQGLEKRRYGSLSGGEKQKLHFALSIAGDPDLLYLDEPTANMDVETRMSLWAQIQHFRRQERTVVLNTHNLEEAERLADRIVLIDHGRVIADATPANMRSLVGTTMVSAKTELTVELLRQLPGVLHMESAKEEVRLIVNSPEITVRKWLDLDPGIRNLEVKPAQLQEAYLHLVKGSTE